MYCVKCGVELADTEKTCPLCGTPVFHPMLSQPDGEPLYPAGLAPAPQLRPWGALLALTVVLFLLPILVTLLCDLQMNRSITWSGFVVGGLLTCYVALVLPFWFRRPNPVIFVPCAFAAAGVYLLYINLATGGRWFLTLAFPVTGVFGLIATAVVALCRYIRRGRLYIFGGAALATAAFMPVLELLIKITFRLPRFAAWSVYPAIALGLIGALLLVIAICRPVRESLGKRFFF